MKKLTWYHELGFFNNPFSVKPTVFHNEIIGHHQTMAEITKEIMNSGIILISGEYGTGKTTSLKRIIFKFRSGRLEGKKVIYYNCNQSEKSIDFDKLLINAGGFFRKLFRIRKKNMIILLDEAQDMNKKDMEQVEKYYDTGFLKSVVFVSKNKNLKFSEGLKEKNNINKFELSNMDNEEAIEMIRKRIGKLQFISDEIIVKIFNVNKNSRAFLKNCEDVCKYTFDNGNRIVEEEYIKKALK